MKRLHALLLVLIAMSTARAAPGAPVETPDTSTVILSSRTLVAASQNLLSALGYEVGGWDGRLDGRTAAAVRRFQADNGLPDSGKVSGDLLIALTRVLGQRLGSPHGEAPDWEIVGQRIRASDPGSRRALQERSEAAARLILKSRPEALVRDSEGRPPGVDEAIELLYANGLLVGLDAGHNRAVVSGESWDAVSREVRMDIAEVLAHYCEAENEGNWIAIVESVTGKPLAKYNPVLGYRRAPR